MLANKKYTLFYDFIDVMMKPHIKAIPSVKVSLSINSISHIKVKLHIKDTQKVTRYTYIYVAVYIYIPYSGGSIMNIGHIASQV